MAGDQLPAPGLMELMTIIMKPESLLQYMQGGGLLKSTMICVCSKSMKLQRRNIPDGFIWACNNRNCLRRTSIRQGSIFENMKTNLGELLLIFYFFCTDTQLFQTGSYLPHVKKRAMRNFYQKLSAIAAAGGRAIRINHNLRITSIEPTRRVTRSRAKEGVSTIVCNDEGIVEIDESKFGRRRKGNKGNNRVKRKWIVGLVQRDTRKTAFLIVVKRDASTLLPFIRKRVKSGTTIYTDEWRAYGNLKNEYKHAVVCHEKEYITADGTHTNTIEGK